MTACGIFLESGPNPKWFSKQPQSFPKPWLRNTGLEHDNNIQK